MAKKAELMTIPEEDRRKSPDIWVKIVRILAIVAWVVFTIALFVSYYAAPDTDYGVLRYHEITIRKFWLTPLTGYLYLLLWISALLSYICLVIHKFRSRRKTDNKQFNYQLLFVISIAWVVYIALQLIQ